MRLQAHHRLLALCWALFAGCCVGCTGELLRFQPTSDLFSEHLPQHGGDKKQGTAKNDSQEKAKRQKFAEVVAGLEAMERLDPQTRDIIQNTLEQTPPAQWHYVFRYYSDSLRKGQGAPALPRETQLREGAAAGELQGFAPRPGHAGQQQRFSNGSGALMPRGQGFYQENDPSYGNHPPRSTGLHPVDAPQSPHAMTPVGSSQTMSYDMRRAPIWPAGYQLQQSGPADGNWDLHLKKAIASLEAQTAQGDDRYGQTLLRLLYVVAGRKEEALRPIPGTPPAEREFWSHEMRGLLEYLDTNPSKSPERRFTEAARWFRDASSRVAELGTLQLHSLAFCTEVKAFGDIVRFARDEFHPGDPVLLYAELENFTCQRSESGAQFRTSFRAYYEILSGGQPLQRHDLPTSAETCPRPRRDFFVSYQIKLPAELKPGEYTLHLTMEDTLSSPPKFATRSIVFRIQ